ILAVTVLVFFRVGWDALVSAVQAHHGAGGFDPLQNREMGWSYLLFQSCLQVAATLTWQPVIARLLAARDVRTGRSIYVRTSFFFACRFVLPGLWGIAALATLAPGAFQSLPPDLAADPSKVAMPAFLAGFVPTGMMGLLVAAMLAADMSTDSSY